MKLDSVPHVHPEYTYKEGGYTVTRGSAWSGPGCHDGCGVLIYTDEDGTLVKVEGDPENPYNQGRLCVRCLAVQDVVNSPQRLQHPMRRRKDDRGKDAWEEISWDEALDLVYDNFMKIKEEYGPESVIFMMGTGRDINPWITRLAYSFGSPNSVFPMSGEACYTTRVLGCMASTGCFWVGDYSQQFPDRYDNVNWKCPDTVVLWGNDPLVANSDGMYGHWLIDVMKRGAKIINIDPRVNWLAAKSDLHLQIRPGTDAALALGMLNYIIQNDLYDHDFVDRWCYGFDELAEHVKPWTLEKTEQVTWIPKEKVVEAAEMIAKSDGAILQWGVALDMTKEALPTSQAAFDIFCITGQIERPGGMLCPTEIIRYAGGWGFDDFITPEQDKKRAGYDDFTIMGGPMAITQTDRLIAQIETDEPYRIAGAWIQTTNFLACTTPDPKRLVAAMNRLDFIAAVDMFMTPTIMALADVVLPVSCYTEKHGLRVGDGFQRLETINKASDQRDTKSDVEINLALGKRFNPEAWPWDDVKGVFGAVIKEKGGMDLTFDEARDMAPAYQPFEYRRYESGKLRPDGQPGFNTPTGRVELWSTFFDSCNLDPMPYFEEPEPSPYSTPELAEKYPLILTTGARSWWSFHSEHRQIPSLRSHKPWPEIEVHPETAAANGLRNGDWCWVENDRGRCKRVVKVTPSVNPKVVSADHGWWLPEEKGAMDDGLFGMWDVDVNSLLRCRPGKSGLGANYKTTICRIYPVTPNDEHNEWRSDKAYTYISKEAGTWL